MAASFEPMLENGSPPDVVAKVVLKAVTSENPSPYLAGKDIEPLKEAKRKMSDEESVHHNNSGEIVPLVEYLVGRKSGRYQPSHPSWYRRSSKEKRIHNFGRPTAVADSIGEAFRTGALQRQQQGQYQSRYHQQSFEEQERYHRLWQEEQALWPSTPPSLAAIQDQPPDVISPYPNDPTFQSESTDDEKTTTLSQEATLKIQELKRLVYRYAQYYRNPDAIIKCATYWSINGDNMILDEMLEKLRMIGIG